MRSSDKTCITIRRVAGAAIIAATMILPVLSLPLHDEFGAEVGVFRNLRRMHPAPLVWEKIADGFDRTVMRFEGEDTLQDPPNAVVNRKITFLVYRIDPKIYPIRVITAPGLFGTKKASLADAHRKMKALLTTNGGFFDEEGDPVGFVISDHKKRSDYNKDGGSGYFAVYGHELKIGWADKLSLDPVPDQALQNGPILVEPDGAFGIIHIRYKFFYRTVLGIDREDRLLVGVTRKSDNGNNEMSAGLNLFETAAIFYQPEELGGLGAKMAVNLDGGTSTGMEATFGSHADKVRVGISLPNFVCVMPPKK